MSDLGQSARETRTFVRRFLAIARRNVDHEAVAENVYENGGLSGRYLIMTGISAAIAILGLMLSSPAVVIGAMLMSPMMGPIVALGFSLALLDFSELNRALRALALGFGLALIVAVVLTLLSPLKEPTTEILARTRPNFFDLLIAVFSGIAGAYAVIKQRGETIIGVAIATALMPPVATVGFGLGTGDMGIAGGAFFLFMTNLVAIALAATLTAGFYGFRPRLMERPVKWRGVAVVLVFAVLSAPLALSLRAIGLESRATAETRLAVDAIFSGSESRITLLDVRSQSGEVSVSALVSTRSLVADAESRLQQRLTAALHVPVVANLDQIVVADPEAASRAVQASPVSAPDPVAALRGRLIEAVPFATDAIMLNAEGSRAVILLRPEAGLDLQSAYALETALTRRFEGLTVLVTPPVQVFDTVDLGDPQARARAVWALSRWRATPAVRACRPEQPPEPESPPAEGENAPARLDFGQTFIAELTAAGVSTRTEGAPACQRGDINVARLSLN
ncbi:TIGR00341 family protein [Brevundimonas poindexterae]|uniref:TIGR00341 family protein n=1 Tax=Brevundimonas poindexterae TaxID=74325 RepID=UPI001CFC788F|nr:TIGR00341 family protein [Brevundimonas poindexterae]